MKGVLTIGNIFTKNQIFPGSQGQNSPPMYHILKMRATKPSGPSVKSLFLYPLQQIKVKLAGLMMKEALSLFALAFICMLTQ